MRGIKASHADILGIMVKIRDEGRGVVNGGNYDLNIPFGLTFGFFDIWEFGVATRDVVTLISNETPTISIVAGFLRFRIGKETPII